MNQFITCTTDQLTEQQIGGICDLFRQIFGKEKSIEHFKRQFFGTCRGHSYHCIYEKEQKILANFCIVPYEYTVNGKKMIFGLSVDTIVSPEAKLGPFAVADMAALTENLAKADGCRILYGFPNDNAYQYNIDILQRQSLGFLEFYILPLALGKLRRMPGFLNFLRYFSIAFATLCKLAASSKSLTYPIEKVDSPEFRQSRYGKQHHFVQFKGGEAIYTLFEESFGTVAYLIDITPLSKRNFYAAFLQVASEVKNQAGLIVYPGNKLPFGSILRMPHRFLPRKLQMVVSEMGETKMPEPVYCSMSNWKINLSDFDVR